MDYDQDKFERLELRATELQAVAAHLREQLSDAILAETTALHHVQSEIKARGIPAELAGGHRFDDGRWRDFFDDYQADPIAARALIVKHHPASGILPAIDAHIKAIAEANRVRQRLEAHAQKEQAFFPFFSRCRAWVAKQGDTHVAGATATIR